VEEHLNNSSKTKRLGVQIGVETMGKGNAEETFGLYLTLEERWKPKLNHMKTVYGMRSVQDVIRYILAGVLETPKKEDYVKEALKFAKGE